MLKIRNNQATDHKDVVYWDNGRELIRTPDGKEIDTYKKELARVHAERVYNSAKDLQLIEELKLDNKALRSMLTLSDHSLNNAIKKIKGMAE